MTEDLYLMWLGSLSNASVAAKVRLYEYFGSAEKVWKASMEEIASVPYINEKRAADIISSKNEKRIEEVLKYLQRYGVKYVSVKDPLYPESLKAIHNYPLGFYVYGEIPSALKKYVAVIGTRKADKYGLLFAKQLSCELAENGVTVVSGMAYGIDTYAHIGAIEGGGKTVAVLGCGIDIVYPKENRDLEKKICENGCVITEYAPGTQPHRNNFPIRNRIVSGMSDAVAVIQAPTRSGSLITANFALEQGKTVFAMPGNVGNAKCEGSNLLIRDGAIPLLSVEDILYEIGIQYTKEKNNAEHNYADSAENTEHRKENKEKTKCPAEYADVYECIGYEPISVEDIIFKTGTTVSSVNSVLLMLEYEGYIKSMSANRYIRI